jgi:hypothetical protein
MPEIRVRFDFLQEAVGVGTVSSPPPDPIRLGGRMNSAVGTAFIASVGADKTPVEERTPGPGARSIYLSAHVVAGQIRPRGRGRRDECGPYGGIHFLLPGAYRLPRTR